MMSLDLARCLAVLLIAHALTGCQAQLPASGTVEPVPVAATAAASAPAEPGPDSGSSPGREAAPSGRPSVPTPSVSSDPRGLRELKQELNEAKRRKVLAARESGYAEAELGLARLARDAADARANELLRAARAALVNARDELVRYDTVGRALEAQGVSVAVAEAEAAVVAAEEERALAIARGRLALSTAQRSYVLDTESPVRMRQLADAVRGAEAQLADAEFSGAHARRAAQLVVDRRKDEADDAKRASKAAAARADELQKRWNRESKLQGGAPVDGMTRAAGGVGR